MVSHAQRRGKTRAAYSTAAEATVLDGGAIVSDWKAVLVPFEHADGSGRRRLCGIVRKCGAGHGTAPPSQCKGKVLHGRGPKQAASSTTADESPAGLGLGGAAPCARDACNNGYLQHRTPALFEGDERKAPQARCRDTCLLQVWEVFVLLLAMWHSE